ncbi:MAG: mechanosensitive ion channel domain-containing protein [Anderseniella sp.]|jgi:small-conductance mechanosensitive channel|nr:mechanosensitive ion channel domain-containing protein [Anderseniella sp.]
MTEFLRSAVRLWLVLLLLLTGPGLALAQSQTQTQTAPAQEQTQEQPAPAEAAPAPAQPETAVPLPPGVADAAGKARRQAGQFTAQLEEFEARFANPSITRDELTKLRAEIEALREQVRQADQEVEQPLAQISNQISLLGPEPAEGASETASVAAQRAQLNKARDELAGAKAQLALVSGSVSQLAAKAAQTERDRFLNTLLGNTKSAVNPMLWTGWAAELPALWDRTVRLFSGFATQLTDANDGRSWPVWLLLACLLSIIAAVTVICRMIAQRARRGQPGEAEFQKYLRTVMVPAGYTLTAVIAFFLFRLIYGIIAPDTPRMLRLVDALGAALVGFAFMRAVARSILSPGRPEWRVVPLSSHAAAEWLWLSTIAFGLIGFSTVLKTLTDLVNMDARFAEGSNALLALLLAAIAARLILTARHDGAGEDAGEPGLKPAFGWVTYMIQPAWLLVIGAFVALLFGYITLGSYLSSNVYIVATVVALLYCIRCLSDAFVAQGLKPRSRISKMLKSAFSMSDKGINRASIALNAGVDMSLLLLGLPLVLALTSLTWVDVRSWLTTAFFGFKVGDITISLSSILVAVVVFAIGLGLTRFVTGWLDRRILTPTDMDAGVRNSLRTAAGYLAVIIVLLMAFAAAGVDFSNIALVAGALSVGIGFGLQSIVNNFVSGLILLAERPIKVGDWVQVAGGEGTVRKINVRSTEIETFDRCSIIVPNSSLISDTVSNWTHGDLMGRVRVMVGVSYGADPKQVEEILLDCARSHPRALQFPEATVLFKDFGASSLDFEVRVFIDDVNWVAFVGSDLRFTIHKALKEAGIEIPFPQRDVNVRGLKEAVHEAMEEAQPVARKRPGKGA